MSLLCPQHLLALCRRTVPHSLRYDVELYQRIEQLIGKKLPLYRTVEEEVLALMERVSEAQRHAKMVTFMWLILRRPLIEVALFSAVGATGCSGQEEC